MTHRALVLSTVALLVSACGGGGGGPTPPPPPPPPPPVERPELVTNGAVNAIAVAPDGTAYLGGDFTAIGPWTGSAVVLDPTTGALAAPAPKFSGQVLAAAPDGNGGWYVAGSFRPGAGAPLTSLARLRGDGTVDPAFVTSFDGAVEALAAADGVVYAGGRFEHVGGAARHRLAAVDGATGAVTAWNPTRDPAAIPGLTSSLAPGFGVGLNLVSALAVGNGVIYAGGVARGERWSSWIAAIDPEGAVSAWRPVMDGMGVEALAVRGTTLYAGGSFTTVDGQPRTGLAAFDAAGALSPWSVAAPYVQALAVVDGTLYVGGWFTQVNGQPHVGAFAVDPSGAVSTFDPRLEGDAHPTEPSGAVRTWDPHVDGDAHAFVRLGETLYVAGEFGAAGGARRTNLAAFDRSGALLPWNPAANGPVSALVLSGGKLLAGGGLNSVGAARRSHLAALDAAGRLTAWDPDLGGTSSPPSVKALALVGDRVYAGGVFDQAGGADRRNLAAFDLDGHVLATTPAVDGPVYALASLGGAVYAGGAFTTAGGVHRAGLVAFDPAAGGTVLAFDPALVETPAATPNVYALAARGATLYVGGHFAAAAGAPRQSAAAFAADGTLLPWDPRASDTSGARASVSTLVPAARGVYIGGWFARLGDALRWGVGLVDGTTGAAAAWDPVGRQLDTFVTARSILPVGDTVYVGGSFSEFGDQPRACVAAADAVTGAVTAWNPSAAGDVRSLGVSGGRVLIGAASGLKAVAP
jgi:hypothetical protein